MYREMLVFQGKSTQVEYSVNRSWKCGVRTPEGSSCFASMYGCTLATVSMCSKRGFVCSCDICFQVEKKDDVCGVYVHPKHSLVCSVCMYSLVDDCLLFIYTALTGFLSLFHSCFSKEQHGSMHVFLLFSSCVDIYMRS